MLNYTCIKMIEEITLFLESLQNGDYGKPSQDDLTLAGKLHQVIEEYYR